MILVFQLVYACAAFFSIAAAALIIASLFIADRAPQSLRFLGISLVISAVFLGIAVIIAGIQRHVVAIAMLVDDRDTPGANPKTHVSWLLVYLVAGGAFLCATVGLMGYGILARIDAGFAVFG